MKPSAKNTTHLQYWLMLNFNSEPSNIDPLFGTRAQIKRHLTSGSGMENGVTDVVMMGKMEGAMRLALSDTAAVKSTLAVLHMPVPLWHLSFAHLVKSRLLLKWPALGMVSYGHGR